MADSHPPEGLRKIVAQALRDAGMVNGEYDDSDGQWIVETKTWQYDAAADAVLAALFEACEVREERRIVIDDEQVTGMWLPTTLAGDGWHVASRYPSGRVERRFVIETQPEPVSSTGEESTGA